MEIKYIFSRFTSIWGNTWEKDFNLDPKGVANEWADALAGLSRRAIDKGIKSAREHEKYTDFPPKVGAFLKLCQGIDIAAGPRINIIQASEFANKRVQRLYPYKTKEMHHFVNDVYEHLRDRMYNTQNEHCDFAKCAVDDCYHFQIFDSARLAPWLCVKHEGN